MTDREFAIGVVRTLRGAGFQAMWAGGCVRDELLGQTPSDYDVATDARPAQVRRLFPRTVAVGASFGVVEVLGPPGTGGPLSVEVATFRSDGEYLDGRRPEQVTYSNAEADARRRDFTVNGMFLDPLTGEIRDYVGGREDLRAGILRAIGDPVERFHEDRLRMLRAVRIATRFGLRLEERTREAICRHATGLVLVSAERVADELRKLLILPRRAEGAALLMDLGLMAVILPEVAALAGDEVAWPRTLRVLERLGDPCDFPLGLAALLHDVGRPRGGGVTGQERPAEKAVLAIAGRLRLSTAERERVAWLVSGHEEIEGARTSRPSNLKKLLVREGIGDLLRLHESVLGADDRPGDSVSYCRELLRLMPPEELNPPALISGHDLIGELGMKPGPDVGRVLGRVRDAQLDGEVRTRGEALERARIEMAKR